MMILQRDGTIRITDDAAATEQFETLCRKNGLIFLNMGDRFKAEYEAAHILPYGFINTSVGGGHLNKYGHAMIAEELYKIIGGGV